jgi:hypothetical protein
MIVRAAIHGPPLQGKYHVQATTPAMTAISIFPTAVESPTSAITASTPHNVMQSATFMHSNSNKIGWSHTHGVNTGDGKRPKVMPMLYPSKS